MFLDFLIRICECYDYLLIIASYIYIFKYIKGYHYFKSLLMILLIDIILTNINYWFNINISGKIYFEVFLVFWIGICRFWSNLKTEELLDKDYFYTGFYKSKEFQQHLKTVWGLNYSSSCGFAYDKHLKNWCMYRQEKKFDIMQKVPFTLEPRNTLEYVKENYIIKKTDIKLSYLNKVFPNWEQDLLSQKARQPATLMMRRNCIRSFRNILKYSEIWSYHWYDLAATRFYLLRLRIFKGIR